MMGRPVFVQPLSLTPFDSSPSRGASGETVHFAGTAKASPDVYKRQALACAALCWTILNDSSNIMTDRADIVLGDFSGMTQDEVNASEQVASGQVVVNWEEEYNNDYAAGHVYKLSLIHI